MAVIPAVTSAVKKFYGKPMHVASKVLGVASTAAVIYDAHINAKERSITNFENKSADRFFDQYKQYMTCEKDSATLAKMKKWWFNLQQDIPLDDISFKVGGYISGFGRTIARELPVIALSALTLIPKNPKVNKTAGTLLALGGLTSFLTDVIGIGSSKTKNHY